MQKHKNPNMEKYPHYLERLQNATRKYWDKAALNSIGGESFTYGQMATQIEKFHLVFEKMGIKKGEKIALWARNGARWGMSYLAVNTYETVIVPLLADFTADSAAFLVNHSESIALFTNEDKFKQMDIAKMPDVRFVVDVDSWKLLFARDAKDGAAYNEMDALFAAKWPNGYGADDVVFPTDNWDNLSTINYTSGSTGDPKGVMLTYRNFCANVDFSQRNVPAGDKMVSMLPMAHMYGLVIEFIYPLCNGTAIYWLGKAPTPAALLKAFADVKPLPADHRSARDGEDLQEQGEAHPGEARHEVPPEGPRPEQRHLQEGQGRPRAGLRRQRPGVHYGRRRPEPGGGTPVQAHQVPVPGGLRDDGSLPAAGLRTLDQVRGRFLRQGRGRGRSPH